MRFWIRDVLSVLHKASCYHHAHPHSYLPPSLSPQESDNDIKIKTTVQYSHSFLWTTVTFFMPTAMQVKSCHRFHFAVYCFFVVVVLLLLLLLFWGGVVFCLFVWFLWLLFLLCFFRENETASDRGKRGRWKTRVSGLWSVHGLMSVVVKRPAHLAN